MRMSWSKCKLSQAPDAFPPPSTNPLEPASSTLQQKKEAVVTRQEQEANIMSHRDREVELHMSQGSEPQHMSHCPTYFTEKLWVKDKIIKNVKMLIASFRLWGLCMMAPGHTSKACPDLRPDKKVTASHYGFFYLELKLNKLLPFKTHVLL